MCVGGEGGQLIMYRKVWIIYVNIKVTWGLGEGAPSGERTKKKVETIF